MFQRMQNEIQNLKQNMNPAGDSGRVTATPQYSMFEK